VKLLEKTMRFEISIDNVQEVNPLFSKCDIKVLYTGLNRNNSDISKPTVEKSLFSIFNIPIVAEYIETTDNFGGHGGKVEITDNSVKYIQTTKPYGVVPESAKTYWENVDDGNGNIKEYLVVEGAYLWTGRYSELKTLLEQPFGQSMEIEIQSGKFEKKDGKDVFVIEDFLFSALCILGVDKNGEGHVEPCFEDSSITAYSLNKQSFKEEFSQMIKELQFSLSNENKQISKKGGENVDEKLELLNNYTQLGEDVLEQVKKGLENYSLEVLENHLEMMTESEPRQDETVETPEQFTLTGKQLQKEIRTALGKETITDRWGDQYRAYWFVDHDDVRVIAEESESNRLVSMDYSLNGDFVEIDYSTKKLVKIAYVDMEGEPQGDFALTSQERKEYDLEVNTQKTTSDVENKFSQEKAEVENVKEELSTLREFKANADKAEKVAVIEKFSELPEEAIKPFLDEVDKYSKEELELNLLAEVGKRNLSFSKKDKKKSDSIVSLTNFESTPDTTPSWFSLVQEYKENKNN
jgi:hypothetical protein